MVMTAFLKSNLFSAIILLIFCCIGLWAIYQIGYKQGMVERKLKGGDALGGYYIGEEAYKRGLLIVIVGASLYAFGLFAILAYFWLNYIWPYIK